MEENFRSKLRHIHRVNRLLWNIILVDVLIISVIAIVLWYFNVLSEPVFYHLKTFNDISLIIVIILLLKIQI